MKNCGQNCMGRTHIGEVNEGLSLVGETLRWSRGRAFGGRSCRETAL